MFRIKLATIKNDNAVQRPLYFPLFVIHISGENKANLRPQFPPSAGNDLIKAKIDSNGGSVECTYIPVVIRNLLQMLLSRKPVTIL